PTVGPVLPGRTAPARPRATGPGREVGAEGGVPCRWCGMSNHPGRHYCARCAMSMAATEEQADPERLPWWRRLFDHRGEEVPWAGERPLPDRGLRYLLRWLIIGVVASLLILGLVRLPGAIEAARDHFAERAPVAPNRVDASWSYGDQGPELAFDKLNNTWWGPGVSQAGKGEWIEARFDEPVDLLDVVITPGVSTRADQLGESALPRRMEVEITHANGVKTTRDITLDQGVGPQHRDFRAKRVVTVRFVLDTAYAASDDKQVAIAEIEFFGPSTRDFL
ncbi:NADase-type glycan-binding domain-containing protein, partial [Streptomyces calidiresistens]|uniref:NADase-type glycan-binding domain-containing protein n=1 Tax=Streptomyces calidiresistens TaxID=1485586 RepID=UPI001E34704C